MNIFRNLFVGAVALALGGNVAWADAGSGLIAINFNARAQQVSQSGSVISSGSENNWVVSNDSGALDYVIPAAAWLQLDGRQDWGTKATVTVYDYETQQSDSSRTAKVGWNAENIWAWTDASAKILRGYLDDSGSGATVTVTEIPFAKYDVIFYAATDADKQFGAPEINGKRYTYASGETVEGDAAWGASQSTTAAYGTNALRVNGLSGDLTVKGYGNNDAGYRGGIAALVIVEGEVEEVVTKEYTYNGFLTSQFADTGWKFDLTKLPEATITGQMSGSSIANRPADSNGYFAKAPDANGVASFQMQVYQYNHATDHYLKAVKVELKVGDNGNVWARAAGTANMVLDIGPSEYDGSHEFTSLTGTPATNPSMGGYGVASVKIVVNDDEPYDGPVADAVWIGEDLNGATKGAYALKLNGNSYADDAITISGDSGVLIDWDTASTGPFTVIVKYENLNLDSSSEQVLATVKDGNYADHVGVHLQARNANYVKGIWQNNTWRNTNTKVAEEPMPSASGIFTLGYKRDGGTQLFYQSAEGDEAEKVYEYKGLNSSGSTYSGVAIGGKRGGGWAASDMKITAIALFTGKRLTAEELAAYRFPEPPEPVLDEFVFENTDCTAIDSGGQGDYIPQTLTIPVSSELPAGTKLRIKSITFAQQTGYAWNYSAEFLTINGVKSDSRNGNSQTLESWSIGDKLEYVFSNDAVITVGEAANLGLDQGNGTGLKDGAAQVRVRLFKTTADEYGYIRLNLSMDQWRPAYKIVAERYVPVSGAACLYDWTFTNTVTSVGKNAGTLNWDTNSGDGAKYASTRFFADVNYKYGAALNLQSTPYANFDVKYGTSWSTATIGIMPNVAKCIFVTLGTKANHLGLARGENENEVWVIGNGVKLDSFMVDDAETVSHVYVMALEGGTLRVFVDGTLKSTVETAITIANKLQIGSAHGGAPAGLQRADQDAVSNGASVQALRIYDHVLSAGEMSALKNEFYVAPPPPRDPMTIYWKGGDGTIDGSTTFEDEDGNEVKYISGDEIVIDDTCNVTLARSVGDLHIKNGAVLQIASASGSVSKLFVDEGGTFDVNGVQDKTYPIVLNGGTLANYGTAVGDGKAQFWNLEVAADSSIDAQSDFGTIASKYGSQEFKLGGNKLTKLGAGKFFIAEATFTGGGTLDIQEGTIVLRNGATLPNNLTVKVGPNGETITAGVSFTIRSGKITFDISEALKLATNEITLFDAKTTVTAEKFALTGLPEDPKQNWQIQIENDTIIKAVNEYVLLRIGGVAYSSIEAAFKNVRTNGASVEIVDTERLAFEDGVLKEYGEGVDLAPYAVELNEGEAGAITVNLAMAEGPSLIVTEVMPKSTDAVNHGALESYDINGLASGWVEVKNTSDKWVDLKDYKFIRVNRSKANSKGDYGNFPSRLVAPNSLAIFYTSERYANSADMSVSAFATPVDAKTPHIFTELNDVLVWPDKVNPKKFPFVRLYYAPNGEEEEIVDTIVIPSDLPEGMSIIVEPVEEGKATVRYICEAPTRGEENPSTDGLVKLGPNVGPLYEVEGGAAHKNASEFGAAVPMAVAGEDYEIDFALNPTMSPTEAAAFREEDEITGIKLIYRKDLDDATLDETVVDLEAKATDATDMGDTYKVSIPSDYFPAAGHLIQWKFEITDAAGNTWTSPSYHNKDDGYEWYGTIVKPTEGQESSTLTTWHMFADAGSVQQMDVDADEQNLAVVPNNARVAIYDSSTSNYYDYVRIDLRGNTTASFHKKSHGLRFAKAHPLTMKDVVTGETVKEIRKSSLIAEYSDPSFLRQVLAFWFFNRNGSPAPFDFPVRCNLNGEFFELGFHSERFTDELIEDIYGLDKFGYGYKNIGSFGNGTSAGGIEKKTPDDEDEKNLTVLNAFCNLLPNYEVKTDADRTKYTKVVVEKMDLPAWLNYIALSKITQEMDDVWANLSGYLDDPAMLEGHRGTGAWMPLAYDMNTSLGVWYKEVSFPQGGPMAKEDWFKSHPFYGGYALPAHSSAASTAPFGRQNRAYEAIFQNEKFRRLYLRRLRTLMDAELGEPDVAETFETCEVPLVVKMRELIPLISADAVLDRAKWGYGTGTAIDVWGAANFPKTVELGAEDLYANFIVPRREHLYVTHSIDAANVGYGTEYSAGIPHAQSAIEDLREGITAEYDETLGAVVIQNTNEETVDLSKWELGGPVSMTIPAGTVLDQAIDGTSGKVYITANRRATVAAFGNELSDQVIVGNGKQAKKLDAKITLTAADGTKVIFDPSPANKYLRLAAFCGNTANGGDSDEWFELKNISETETLDLKDVTVCFLKDGDAESKDHCHITFEGGSLAAGTTVRFNQADFAGKGWVKIQNNKQVITILDAVGIVCQKLKVAQSDFDLAYGCGAYLECRSTESSVSNAHENWRQVYDIAVGNTVYSTEQLASVEELFADALTIRFGVEVKIDDIAQTVTFPNKAVLTVPREKYSIVVSKQDAAMGTMQIELAAPEIPEGVDPYEGDIVEPVEFGTGTYYLNNANFQGGITIVGDAVLHLVSGTENTIATISAPTNRVVFEGRGKLSMSGSDTLVTAAGMTVENGTLDFEFAGDTDGAIVLTAPYIQNGGSVTMNLNSSVEVYGFYCNTKTDNMAAVELNGGTFATTIKGGEGSATFKLAKGSNDVSINGTDVTIELAGAAPRFVETAGKIELTENCGRIDIKTIEDAGGACVFNSEKGQTLAGGAVVVDEDAGVNGQIFVSSTKSITVVGGVYSLNATGKILSAATDLSIKGGILHALSSADDPIVAVGSITVSGGYVFAFANSAEHSAFGVNATELAIGSGATVIAVGGQESAEPSEGSAKNIYRASGMSSSKKYVELSGVVADDTSICTTVLTVSWKDRHPDSFAFMATMPGFDGETIVETKDKPTDIYPEDAHKLDEDISGVFVREIVEDIPIVDYNGGELLTPYAVKDQSGKIVVLGTEGTYGSGRTKEKVFDGDLTTFFDPPDNAADVDGAKWAGLEFENPVMITCIKFAGRSSKPLRINGCSIQGANTPDFSDAENVYLIEVDKFYAGEKLTAELEDVHGPYKYLRVIGEYCGNIAELEFYGLVSSGKNAPVVAPQITESKRIDGKATFTIVADTKIPQVYRVERTMIEGDGDEEAFLSLGLASGASFTWTDVEETPFTSYRVQGVNANGASPWTSFTIAQDCLAGDAKPTFSVAPGEYADTQSLEIAYPDAAAQIYYTTDGSAPVGYETDNCHLYTGAITLSERPDAPAVLGKIPTSAPEIVNKQGISYAYYEPKENQPFINVVRARAFKDGVKSAGEAFGTWLIGVNGSRHKGLRVVSLQTNPDNFFGDAIGIMVPGDIYKTKGMNSHSVGDPNANYFQSGRTWEREVNLELFEPEDRTKGFNQRVGVRVRGNYSRAAAKKSLTVYNRAEYGAKNLKYQLFNDEPNKKKFKRFLLRNGGNDWYEGNIRDAIAQGVFRGYLRTCSQGNEPSVLYVNGEYWGIYNIRHGYAKQHFENWCGADGDNLDWIKLETFGDMKYEVQEGDIVEFLKLRQYFRNNDFTTDAMLEEAQSKIDFDDMIDYHIVHIFYGNMDWIANNNNVGYWRERKPGAKWRFQLYDVDSVLGLTGGADKNTDGIGKALSGNDGKIPPIFKKLSKNVKFQKMFVNRFADLLNTALKPERTRAMLGELAGKMRPEAERNVTRWTNMKSVNAWEGQIAEIDDFFVNRPAIQIGHLKSRFPNATGDMHKLTLSKDGEGEIQLNTIESGEGAGKFALPFEGDYFENSPITLTAKPGANQIFIGWYQGDTLYSEKPTIEYSLTADAAFEARFEEGEIPDDVKYLRLWGFAGAPDGASTDANEFIVFTNLNQEASLDASSAHIQFEKYGAEPEGRCSFDLPAGTIIEAGGWVRFNQADIPWTKITDGFQEIVLTAANGVEIERFSNLDQSTIIGGKGSGKMAVHNLETDEWYAILITEAPGYEAPPTPPEPPAVQTLWEGTNVTECVTLPPGDYVFKNVSFEGGLDLQAGDYKFKNDGSDSVNSIASLNGPLANVTFTGKGRMNIVGSGDVTLFAVQDLIISNGVFAVDFISTVEEVAAVTVARNFLLDDKGKVAITLDGAKPRGIELSNKKMSADFAGGTFTATLKGTKASAFKFKGSDAVTLSGGTMDVSIEGTGAKVLNGGTIVFEDGYVCNIEGSEDATDATVFESGKTFTVNGGTFDISVPGAGSQIFTTADDPSEKDLTLTINGGTFNLLAGDDCVKSAGNDAVTDPESKNIERNVVITGGNFYGVSLGNDVIDSNGDIIITGGNILAYTTAVEDDGFGSTGLDVNVGRKITVEGGNIIAIGGPNSSFHYEGGVAYTTDSVEAANFSEKFLELTGSVNGQETHVWAKLPELKVETISLFAYTRGIDPTNMPTATTEPPSEEFATGFHDLYIDDLKPVDYDGGELLNPYAEENISGKEGVIPWTGYSFVEPVMITGVTIVAPNGSTMRSIFGSAIQGANEADFSDAVRVGVVEVGNYFEGTLYEVALEDVHGPYKYIRLIGENMDKVTGLNLYGLKSSGEVAPQSAPKVTFSGVTEGKATFTIVADKYVPQVYRVERTMVEGDGDEEAFLPLGLEDGEEYTWTDSEATPFTSYRVQGVNANGESEWTTFTVEPKAVIAGDLRPTFSVKPGAYEAAQTLEITYSDPDAEIWYTTDGSEPVDHETENCHKYTGVITLAERVDAQANLGKIRTSSEKFSSAHSADGFREPTVNQPYVNIIRAKAFKDGAQSQYDAYGTWLIGENATRHEGLRVVSLQTEEDNLFSDATGIMVPGDWYTKVLESQITTWDGHPYANYHQSGREWERLANVELIEGDGVEGFNQQFGIRVRGNYTRAVPKKSLTVFGRAEYGAKNLKYQLFEDEPNHNKFKRFLLRQGGNQWNGAIVTDGVAQGLFRGWLKTCSQGVEPSALYINGEYWGIYNIRHGYSKKHFEDWCGVDGDNIDWVKADPAQNIKLELQEGDLVEFYKMYHYLKDTDFTDNANWEEVKKMVDLEDMIDYHIVGIFINNSDWIGNGNGNNGGYWRERKPDGKWRFVLYDCEGGLSSPNNNRINQILNKDDESSDHAITPPFFKKIARNTEFQRMFVTRYADLLNTALKSERTQAILAAQAAAIRPEIERNAARWRNIGTKAQWEDRITSIKTFLGNRPSKEFENMIASFPNVTGSTHTLELSKNGEGEIQLNTIESGEGAGKFALPFEGDYFELTPVTLTAKPGDGQVFSKWIVDGVEASTEPTMELSLKADTSVEAVFVKGEESVEKKFLRLHSFDGITPTPDGDTDEWITLTNLSNEVEINLTGVKVVFQKMKNGAPDGNPKCVVTFSQDISLAAGASITLAQDVYGWGKITNGDLNFILTDADNAVAQNLIFTQKDFKKYYGDGGPGGAYYLQATTFAQESEAFIEVAYPVTEIDVKPGEPAEVEAESEEAAIEQATLVVEVPAEVKELIAEDAYKAYFKLAAKEIETGKKYEVSAVLNPETVPEPEIGAVSDGAEPLTVEEGDNGTVVTVGIVNAKIGLWYGFEATGDLKVDFENDCPSFKLATDPTEKLVLESSPREGASAFFRTKISEIKPEPPKSDE